MSTPLLPDDFWGNIRQKDEKEKKVREEILSRSVELKIGDIVQFKLLHNTMRVSQILYDGGVEVIYYTCAGELKTHTIPVFHRPLLIKKGDL